MKIKRLVLFGALPFLVFSHLSAANPQAAKEQMGVDFLQETAGKVRKSTCRFQNKSTLADFIKQNSATGDAIASGLVSGQSGRGGFGSLETDCGFEETVEEFENQNPEAAKERIKFEKYVRQFVANKRKQQKYGKKAASKKIIIPVVFHVDSPVVREITSPLRRVFEVFWSLLPCSREGGQVPA